MAQIIVSQFAKELGLPSALLIEQLQAAGISRTLTAHTVVTERDKTLLLDYLRQAHGAKQVKEKITLIRGPVRTTVKAATTGSQVEGSGNERIDIDLSLRHLTELPHDLSQLTRLERLNASHNQFIVIPMWIGALQSLRVLDLSHNRISGVANELAYCSSLRELNLAENNLGSIPAPILKLKQLQVLNISGNGLRELPEEIGELTELTVLNVAANELTQLPSSLARLSKLERLIMGNNKISVLPDAIGALPRLSDLNATDNRLGELPDSLRRAPSLQRLFLHNNPGLELPLEVLGPYYSEYKRGVTDRLADPRDIFEFYLGSRRGTRPLNEAKMILVGRGGAGKTSLVNRLVNGRFSETEAKTEGIAIVPWSIKPDGHEPVRLNIWDFGGQEIMHATHQFFLTKRSVYVLVLNAREGEQDANIEYWLRMIESFGGDSPVIVVINKIRDHAFDLNRRGLKAKFPMIQEFAQTDCEANDGIGELAKVIAKVTATLPHLRDPIPTRWFAVKDQLAKAQRNFISYEEYQQLCVGKQVVEQPAQATLVGFLHDLGTVVNFRDHPRLRDTHVLNPRWVTNGIYKILNARVFAERETGEVRVGELAHLLDPDEYPRDKHQFLFDLMEKFELCYESYEEAGLYLIPELLTKGEPTGAAAYDATDQLRFEYHYKVLPEGLLPRFIVRCRALNKDLVRWRTGVALTFEGNHAIVRADIQDRTVAIGVTGNARGRRRLLSIIRSDFERIHASINRLYVTEMVPAPGYEIALPYAKLKALQAAGHQYVPEVVNDEVVDIDIVALLDGVDVAARNASRMEEAPQDRPNGLGLAFSYSHKDEELRDQLETHLKLLERSGLISTWHDRKIRPGEAWAGVIDEKFRRADLILLLVSSDFISSDYCYETELRLALERHDRRDAIVIPIIIRPCTWEISPFAHIQALPTDGRPITTWSNRDEAWLDVTAGIRKAVEHCRSLRK